MAKAKGKGRKPADGYGEGGDVQAPVGAVSNHGLCADCGNTVDVVVDMHQCVGANRFICPECKVVRINDAAKTAAAVLMQKAEKTREDMRQLPLPGMET